MRYWDRRTRPLPLETNPEKLRSDERWIWAVAYRMTGCAADADEIVQESYVRALEHPPQGETRPYLVRIATNLARDRLRRRRRDGYRGPYLPSPIEQSELDAEREAFEPRPDARYDLAESASFAFLVALEALTPKARAVLVLRDVIDCSVEETAAALGVTENVVKVTHHRARRVLEGYDRSRVRAPSADTRAVLERFLGALAAGDIALATSMLADDAISLHDAGGEFLAAGRPLVGAERIARAMVGIAKHSPPLEGFDVRTLSGAPAVHMQVSVNDRRVGRRSVVTCDLDANGKIARLYFVIASRKLTHVRP